MTSIKVLKDVIVGVGLIEVLTKEMSKATTERREVGFQMPKKLPKRNHVRLVVGTAFDSQHFFWRSYDTLDASSLRVVVVCLEGLAKRNASLNWVVT